MAMESGEFVLRDFVLRDCVESERLIYIYICMSVGDKGMVGELFCGCLIVGDLMFVVGNMLSLEGCI